MKLITATQNLVSLLVEKFVEFCAPGAKKRRKKNAARKLLKNHRKNKTLLLFYSNKPSIYIERLIHYPTFGIENSRASSKPRERERERESLFLKRQLKRNACSARQAVNNSRSLIYAVVLQR